MAVVAVVLIVVISVISSHFSSKYNWAEVLLNTELPKPTSSYGELNRNKADCLSVSVEKVDFSDYKSYLDECIEKGYIYVVESSQSSYTAFNEDGNELDLTYYENDKELRIILKIRNSGTIKWSNSELAMLLPVPKSNLGSVENDYKYGYEVYVGNTTKSEFVDYISKCKEKGFKINVQETEDYFYAENKRGYELIVDYYECDLVYICLEIPDDVADEEEEFEDAEVLEIEEFEEIEETEQTTEKATEPTEKVTEAEISTTRYKKQTVTQKSQSEEKYGYDKNDPFYSANDVDKDGKLTADEWQQAMGDAIDYYSSFID